MAEALEIIKKEITQNLEHAKNWRQEAREAFERAAANYEKALQYSRCDESGFHNFKDGGSFITHRDVCTNCGWEHLV